MIILPLGNESGRIPYRYLMKLHQTLLATLLLAPMAPLHAVEPSSVQLNGQQCIRVNDRPFSQLEYIRPVPLIFRHSRRLDSMWCIGVGR